MTRDSTSTERAIQHCHRITQRRARNFYYGLKLLPTDKRSAMYVIYSWMREADDLVDSSHGGDLKEIQERVGQFRDATNAALAGRPIGNQPLWDALAETARTFQLSSDQFHAMLEGQIDDLNHQEYKSFDNLRQYCERVASSVGRVCIEIWGYTNHRAQALSIDRGIAFQLTNILRDFREDFDAGRVYIPQDDFNRCRLSPDELRQWKIPQACRELVLNQVERAESFYDRSIELDELITPSCRPALRTMTNIYRRLLEKIKLNPEKIVSDRRVRLSSIQKAAIALKSKWGSRRESSTPSRTLQVSESAKA